MRNIIGFLGKPEWKFTGNSWAVFVEIKKYVINDNGKNECVEMTEKKEYNKWISNWQKRDDNVQNNTDFSKSIEIPHFGRCRMNDAPFQFKEGSFVYIPKTVRIYVNDNNRNTRLSADPNIFGKSASLSAVMYNELEKEFIEKVSDLSGREKKLISNIVKKVEQKTLIIDDTDYFGILPASKIIDDELEEIIVKEFDNNNTELNIREDLLLRNYLCNFLYINVDVPQGYEQIRNKQLLVIEQFSDIDEINDINKYDFIYYNGNLFQACNKEEPGEEKLVAVNYVKTWCYYCYKKGNKVKKYSYDEMLVLWKLFRLYHPNMRDYLSSNEEERNLLLAEYKRFLPEGCDFDWIDERIAVDKVLGITEDPLLGNAKNQPVDNRVKEYESYRDITIKRNIEDDFKNCSNDLKNLYITVSQGFITVITGLPGTAKGALCEALGEGLQSKDIETRKEYSRFQNIRAKRSWKDRGNFETDFYKPEGEHYGIFDWLNFEARKESSHLACLPYIITINRAGKAQLDDYFEDFLEIRREWYRKEKHFIGDTELMVPKSLRVILEMNYEHDGILSPEILGIVSVIEPEKPYELQVMISENKLKLKDVFDVLRPHYYGSTITDEEIWKDPIESGIKTKLYREMFKQFIDKVSDCFEINGKKVVIESVRTEHVVSRYWIKARKYLNEDVIPTIDELKESFVPENVIIDEDVLEIKGDSIVAGYVALDYALSQFVLPFVTKVKGKVEILNPSMMFEFLLENKLLRCARLLKQAIEAGRVGIADELSENSNNELIIKKCERIYDRLLKNDGIVDPDDLIDSISSAINQLRDPDTYTRNVIVNMLICLSQGFLTVFSGKPGCGKTSICRILGGVLGLWNFKEKNISSSGYDTFNDRIGNDIDPARYIEVSTEKGWTSKRDFIGYYNPLTEQFDKANALLYNAFLVLDDEAKKQIKAKNDEEEYKSLPCFILLDEANLSPMEHYWADFMNLCEEWKETNAIDLGGGKRFLIPESLHFAATINNDHTTQILSPRLIDRANVIDLPAPGSEMFVETDKGSFEMTPVSWDALKEVFGCSEKDAMLFEKEDKSYINEEYVSVYKEIKKYVEEHFFVSISPRTDIAVSRYWTKAKDLFEEEYASYNSRLKEKIEELLNRSDINEYYSDSNPEEIMRIDYEIEGVREGAKIGKELRAIDYAIAQRVLPKITELSGENAFYELAEFYLMLVKKQLYKSAGIIEDMMRRGCSIGFYNYFR